MLNDSLINHEKLIKKYYPIVSGNMYFVDFFIQTEEYVSSELNPQ